VAPRTPLHGTLVCRGTPVGNHCYKGLGVSTKCYASNLFTFYNTALIFWKKKLRARLGFKRHFLSLILHFKTNKYKTVSLNSCFYLMSHGRPNKCQYCLFEFSFSRLRSKSRLSRVVVLNPLSISFQSHLNYEFILKTKIDNDCLINDALGTF